MSDLRDAIRSAADRHRPPKDWFDKIHERAQKKRRNQRILAGVVGLGLSVGVSIALLVQLKAPDHPKPGGDRPAPATQCGSGSKVSPTGWWRGNGSPADALGGHDAVLRGAASFAPGIVGDAFALDGKSAFAEVSDDASLNVGSADFTVALWVRFASTKGEQVFVEDWVEQGTQSLGWTLTKLRSDAIRFALGAAGSVDTDPLDLPLDTWIHVAARRKAGIMSIFVNGQVAATGPLADARLPADSGASLKFGHRGAPGDTPGSLDHRGLFMRGELDEIEFFVGRGLSDAQIQHIFETQSSCAV